MKCRVSSSGTVCTSMWTYLFLFMFNAYVCIYLPMNRVCFSTLYNLMLITATGCFKRESDLSFESCGLGIEESVGFFHFHPMPCDVSSSVSINVFMFYIPNMRLFFMLHWDGCVDAHVCPDGGAKQPSQSNKPGSVKHFWKRLFLL